jgi:hypothetical protein
MVGAFSRPYPETGAAWYGLAWHGDISRSLACYLSVSDSIVVLDTLETRRVMSMALMVKAQIERTYQETAGPRTSRNPR